MKTIHFYFDTLSPYAYMAYKELAPLIKEKNLDVKTVPVLFAGLLNAHGQKGPAEIPAKRAYTWQDTLRWGVINKIEIKGPPTHPFNPLPALRLCETIADEKTKFKLAGALMIAAWEKGLDVSIKSTLSMLSNELGLNGEELTAKIDDPAIKEKIKKNTEDAIAHGVFGVPTFRIDNELFWGHDRLHQVLLYLEGKLNVDENLLQQMIDRPRGIDRK